MWLEKDPTEVDLFSHSMPSFTETAVKGTQALQERCPHHLPECDHDNRSSTRPVPQPRQSLDNALKYDYEDQAANIESVTQLWRYGGYVPASIMRLFTFKPEVVVAINIADHLRHRKSPSVIRFWHQIIHRTYSLQLRPCKRFPIRKTAV